MFTISPLPSLFGMLKDSYTVSNAGKFLIGSILAQSAFKIWKNSVPASNLTAKKELTAAEAISQLMTEVNSYPSVKQVYDSANEATKLHFIQTQLAKRGIKL